MNSRTGWIEPVADFLLICGQGIGTETFFDLCGFLVFEERLGSLEPEVACICSVSYTSSRGTVRSEFVAKCRVSCTSNSPTIKTGYTANFKIRYSDGFMSL